MDRSLLQLAEELRTLFSEERRAIAALDHARIGELAAQKHELSERLAGALAAQSDPAAVRADPEAREIFAALRIEAQATLLLAAAATGSVRALLGYQSTGGYDRRARHTSAVPERILAAY